MNDNPNNTAYKLKETQDVGFLQKLIYNIKLVLSGRVEVKLQTVRRETSLSSRKFIEASREKYEGNMGKLAIDVDTLSKKKIPKKKKRRTKKRKT